MALGIDSTAPPPGGDLRASEDVRAVSDDEVAFFHENGWALLRNLVRPELCALMLDRGKPHFDGLMAGGSARTSQQERLAKMTVAAAAGTGTVVDNEKWLEWRGAVRDANDPAFSRAALAATMGRNMQRLLGRDQPMRILHDIFACKLPDGSSTATAWHQDSPNFPLDRHAITVWIALDEIQPDQGPVQFYSGSHRAGMLGRNNPEPGKDLLYEYPELQRFPVSPPPHLQPGDCTVHHGLTVHGTGPNTRTAPRWSYFICYFPGDARYSGAPNHDFDGFGLRVGQPVEHPSFSLVPES